MKFEVSTVTDCGTLISGVSVLVAVEMRVAMYPTVVPPPARCSPSLPVGIESGGCCCCGGVGIDVRRVGAIRALAGRGALALTVTGESRVVGVGWTVAARSCAGCAASLGAMLRHR